MLAEHFSDYLFARSTGHFATLMSLINRGCLRAIRGGHFQGDATGDRVLLNGTKASAQ
ncbi:hypothetical protein ABZ543_29475 [Streptomyces roseifaciens]